MLDVSRESHPIPGAAPLSRQSDATLTEQLAARFAERIRARLLAPGARLPSVRECARRHEVSPTTVVAAYDQLLAQGLVEARAQRGFFVRAPLADTGAPRLAPTPRSPLPISATTLIRGMFQPPGAQPMPGLGTLPADWLDAPLLASAMRKVSTQLGRSTLQYGEPAGEARLRRALAARLAEHGIAARADQIVTTVGATHALDVVTRTLLKPGDSVLVDEPGWSVEYARLAALGLRVLPVPRGPEGPDLAAMQRLIEAQPEAAKPRLYVTVSVLHNPTGASLSLQSAHKVLQLAAAHDFAIVEDDTYAHLAPTHLPRLAALDALERTIYVSGFSKILTPSWRVGFLAAPSRWVDRMIDTKLLSTLTTPSMTELALAHCLEQGLLRRHAERIQRLLDAARSRSVELARSHGCRFAAEPRGLFGWVDTGVDTERLAQRMHDDGWLIAPGALFHATHRPTTLMRINFATTQDARFWQALQAARAGLQPLS
ncbi:MAG: PLP-dependent aminotransferase family protein [Piscinibacter sp.]|uniref:aminotransferase-like domain-containing protein n=1 Tax=Piscinibacter sp. TaxID=1903157 RepID=UPI003D0CD00F